MAPSVSIVKKIGNKFRYGLVTKFFLDRLARARVYIVPYYMVREKYQPELETVCGAGLEEYTVSVLGPADMEFLSRIPGREQPLAHYLNLLQENKICVGLKYRDEIAAFSWANLAECQCAYHRFDLNANEAYLFDAYTMSAFRGLKIAPYVRHQLLKILNARGKDTFYSITEFFNRPAIKFKQHFNAEFYSLWLAVSIRERRLGHWRLWGD